MGYLEFRYSDISRRTSFFYIGNGWVIGRWWRSMIRFAWYLIRRWFIPILVKLLIVNVGIPLSGWDNKHPKRVPKHTNQMQESYEKNPCERNNDGILWFVSPIEKSVDVRFTIIGVWTSTQFIDPPVWTNLNDGIYCD